MSSKHWQDVKFRDAYREKHQWCEVGDVLRRAGVRNVGGGRLHLHHICGRVHGFFDSLSNMIVIGGMAHTWCHETEPLRGRIACIWAKIAKGEFNLREMDVALGANEPDAHPLEAWLNSSKVLRACEATAWRNMRLDVLAAVTLAAK